MVNNELERCGRKRLRSICG